jgi:guanylate kinase
MLSEQKECEQTETGPRDLSRGILFVVSSPSGGGKGTLIQHVLDEVKGLSYSVSYTTRAPRDGETEGREYFFVTREKFEDMVAAGDFLEWATVHGNLYGTNRQQVSREVFEGRDIVLEVDVQGAASVRELITDSVNIFILPPSLEVLRQRLVARGTDSTEEIELRLKNAREELKEYKSFDFVIVNDEIDRATSQLACIIEAERARRLRQEPRIKRIIQSFS